VYLGTAEEQCWRVSGKKGTYVVRAQTEAEAGEMARTLKYDIFATGITKIEGIDEMTYTIAKVAELEKSVWHIEKVVYLLVFVIAITLIAAFLFSKV